MFPDGTAFRFDIKTQMEHSAPSNGLIQNMGFLAFPLNFKNHRSLEKNEQPQIASYRAVLSHLLEILSVCTKVLFVDKSLAITQ